MQQLVRLKDVRFVAVFGGKGPWESVIAVVWTIVVACNARPGFGVDFAFEEVECSCIISLQISNEAAWK